MTKLGLAPKLCSVLRSVRVSRKHRVLAASMPRGISRTHGMSCVVELLHCSGDQCQTDHTTDAPKRGKSCCLGSQASHPVHHAPVEGQLQQQLMTHAWQQLLRQQVDHLQWLERRLSLQSKLTWVALRGGQAESMISVFQHTSQDALRVAIMSGVCGCGK